MCKSVNLQRRKNILQKNLQKEFWVSTLDHTLSVFWGPTSPLSQGMLEQKLICSWVVLDSSRWSPLLCPLCTCHFLDVDTLFSYIFKLLQTAASFLQSRLFLSLLFMFHTEWSLPTPRLFLYDLSPINRPRLEAHCAWPIPHLGTKLPVGPMSESKHTGSQHKCVHVYSYQTPSPSTLLLSLDCCGIIRW